MENKYLFSWKAASNICYFNGRQLQIFVGFNGWGIFAPELNTIVPGTPADMVLIENGSSEHVTHA